MSGLPPTVVAAAALVVAVAVALAVWRWWPGRAPELTPAGGVVEGAARVGQDRATGADPAADLGSTGGAGGATDASGTVTVHVVGAVVHPGVFELPVTARVCDAVSAAGGLTGNAAQGAVNLARVLSDGEQIAVPTEDEYRAGLRGAGPPANAASGESAAGPAAGARVNINTADAAVLDELPGVGPSTAAKIVADREANGPFASADDLGRVPGIGPKKLEQLKDAVCVR